MNDRRARRALLLSQELVQWAELREEQERAYRQAWKLEREGKDASSPKARATTARTEAQALAVEIRRRFGVIVEMI